jgi:hypothetical protein
MKEAMQSCEAHPGEAFLEEIAAVALEVGKLLMQAGCSARQIEEVESQIAHAAGAGDSEVSVEYSSLSITVGLGELKVTRTCWNRPMGVNESLYRALINVGLRTSQRALTATDLRTELLRLQRDTRPHPDWLICTSSGRMHSSDSGRTRCKSHFRLVRDHKPKSSLERSFHNLRAEHTARRVYDWSTCNRSVDSPSPKTAFNETLLRYDAFDDTTCANQTSLVSRVAHVSSTTTERAPTRYL